MYSQDGRIGKRILEGPYHERLKVRDLGANHGGRNIHPTPYNRISAGETLTTAARGFQWLPGIRSRIISWFNILPNPIIGRSDGKLYSPFSWNDQFYSHLEALRKLRGTGSSFEDKVYRISGLHFNSAVSIRDWRITCNGSCKASPLHDAYRALKTSSLTSITIGL